MILMFNRLRSCHCTYLGTIYEVAC